MKISIPVILLLLTTFVIFLLTIILDIVQRKKIQKQNCLTVSHHFIGSWEYFDSQRKRLFKFDINPSYHLVLNGCPINVTIVFISPSLFIFKDTYGFTMKLHYFSEEYSYLYDEANERYYRVKKVSTTS
ncbi:DUF4828 domain-containing protein [Vagococcus lutrae]|uniref:DUF4828 domain-containing protein n=1 Tax=Vagococcus lutrae TaxID=81947 RepID=UPI001C95B2EA|nr:DUF4828 domain-containing protein [Vagococcus lutrae]MDT2802193.1 DUF4828 domain-containing protein [Vagococcus lutrae]MDT2805912.1 DUF4828 domain-containing protein [Vagococcus lutrae]MDT2817359.1 DUF4828 domain-containing protein [Vagococcus lutrae]MDT2823892.1 DUF4828 domain-containing protein [Vagococcus lutrae]MDY3706279.1 DUF4828 domain-containing protein [Vagococcus lutrae]